MITLEKIIVKKRQLLLRKGVFPYDWFDDYTKCSKLDEKTLPRKGEFYSELNLEGISDEDYRHAQNVWKEFQCEAVRDYLNKYLETDVLQLADVFENFRNVCQKTYGLDPPRYYTLPGLASQQTMRC